MLDSPGRSDTFCNRMVTKGFGLRVGSVFGAVSDPTRRAILDALREGELRAGDLAARFPLSRPAISRHLRVLRTAGLVRESRRAQARVYSLDAEPLLALDRWIADYRGCWDARLRVGGGSD